MASFTDEKKVNFDIEYIVSKYSGMITRVAFSYVQNRQDADDICQDLLISALNTPHFNDEEHMKSWLIRVCINRAKDHLKYRSRHSTTEFLEAVLAEYPSEENSMLVEITKELTKLAPKERNLIYLHYYEGYSAKEIGKIIGCREGAVHTKLSRARVKLKKILEE